MYERLAWTHSTAVRCRLSPRELLSPHELGMQRAIARDTLCPRDAPPPERAYASYLPVFGLYLIFEGQIKEREGGWRVVSE